MTAFFTFMGIAFLLWLLFTVLRSLPFGAKLIGIIGFIIIIIVDQCS